jgi:hypothetical protein
MNDELRKKAVIRKVTYFGVILALFVVSMFWRGTFQLPIGNPNKVTTRDENGKPVPLGAADRIARLPIAHQAEDLEMRDRDAGDPEVAGALAQVSLVGVRGFVVTGLWNATMTAQKRGEYHEMERTALLLTKLQPHFITPWVFQAWNIAYNVSVETDKLGDQYYYIARGISLLADGDRANTRSHRRGDKVYMVGSPDIRYQLGFYCQNKFSVSDKVATLYSLSQLSMIPPAERDPKRFRRSPNDPVDPVQFREFCERNPQLVRRLKTKLNLKTPDAVVDFLAVNERIPARYDVDTRLPQKDDRAFPVLPVADEESDPRLADYLAELRRQEAKPAAGGPDSIDIRMVARAWFEHALAVCPPPKDGVPAMTPQKGEYDPFRYRIPERPALIVIRFAPARAQNYVAERLQKEGWFDEKSEWNPDAAFDRDARWFHPLGNLKLVTEQLTALGIPSDVQAKLLAARDDKELRSELNRPDVSRIWKAAVPALANKSVEVVVLPWDGDYAKQKEDDRAKGVVNRVWLVPVSLSPGTHARAEWEKTYNLWREAGRKNGLNPENRHRQVELAQVASSAGAVPGMEYTDEQLAAMRPPLTREHIGAARAIQYYEQNRQITQYQRFLDESLAEMESDLATARQLFWDADELHLRDPDGTAELAARVRAVTLWRRVFAGDKHKGFYADTRADSLHENALEQELKVAELLVKSGDAETTARVKAARDGLALVSPALMAASDQKFARAVATDEAQARLALAYALAHPKSDLNVRAEDEVRKFKDRFPNSDKLPTVEATARGLLDGEFAWMKLHPDAGKSMEWVRYSVRVERMMKDGVLAAPEPPSGGQPPMPGSPGGR